MLEAGDYVIRIGNSSRNTVPVGIIRIEDTVRTEEVRNVFASDCNLEEIKAPARTVDTLDVPVILMDSSSFRTT